MRPDPPSPGMVAWFCALVAVGAAVLTMFATQDGVPTPSALVQMSATEPLADEARATDPDFVFVPPQAHYDGVYYYAIARDPLLTGVEHTLIDQSTYRYGHPFYGWVAGVGSLGNDKAVPAALMVMSLLGIGVAGYSSSRLSVELGRTPWGGLLIAASPGLLYAASVSTSECVAAGLMASVLLAWLRGRIVLAGALMVALCLTKELWVMVPVGLALWELAQSRRAHAWPTDLRERVAALVVGPAALAAWYLYVHARVGEWPGTGADGNVAAPFLGWREAFRYAHGLAGGSFDASQIGTTSTPMLIGIAVVLVAAATKAIRLRTPLDGVVLGLVAASACMGWLTLVYPHELVRNPAITLLVAIGSLLVGPYRDEQVPGESVART